MYCKYAAFAACSHWSQGVSKNAPMQAIADQLQGGDMALDYDQILAKRPASEDAIFAWCFTFPCFFIKTAASS